MGEPTERISSQLEISRVRKRRKHRMSHANGVGTPNNQYHHHNGDKLHDVERFFAGVRNSLGVLPPEIESYRDRKSSRNAVDRRRGKGTAEVGLLREIAEKAAEVLPCGRAADRSRQNVVKHQRGDAEFRKRPAKRLLHCTVDSAAYKHAAAFYIDRPDGIGEQHDREDEPRCGLADVAFGFTAGVIRRGSEVVQNNGGGPPEGDECQ